MNLSRETNTYLLPISTNGECWIEKVTAKGILEAENKFVKMLADNYECVDYGGSFTDAVNDLYDNNVIIGEIYDIEEF